MLVKVIFILRPQVDEDLGVLVLNFVALSQIFLDVVQGVGPKQAPWAAHDGRPWRVEIVLLDVHHKGPLGDVGLATHHRCEIDSIQPGIFRCFRASDRQERLNQVGDV